MAVIYRQLWVLIFNYPLTKLPTYQIRGENKDTGANKKIGEHKDPIPGSLAGHLFSRPLFDLDIQALDFLVQS